MNSKSNRSLVLFFLCLSVFLSIEALTISYFTESLDIILKITRHVFVVIIVEAFVLVLCLRFSNLISAGWFGFCIALNLLLLKVAFFSSIDLGVEHALALMVIVFMLVTTWAFFILKKNSVVVGPVYFMVVLILGVVPVSLIGYSHWSKSQIDESAVEKLGGQLQQWSKVKLSKTPNIYVFSFDAMIPSSSAKKHLDIDHLDYVDTLEKIAISRYPSYSIQVPTKPSLNSFMNLDQFTEAKQNLYFNGKAPSFLGVALKNNNYEITNGFSSGFFGVTGPYVDHYIVPPGLSVGKSIICRSGAASGWQSLLFLNVCGMHKVRNAFLEFIGMSRSEYRKLFRRKTLSTAKNNWIQITFDYIEEALKRDRPQFTFFYVFRPNGHTPSGYNDSNVEHRKKYISQFKKQASVLDRALNELHNKVMASDPSAIVFLFGDHGAYITRGQNYLELTEEGKEGFIKDRHAVQISLMRTDNECASPNALTYIQNYSTPSRFMLGVLDCLTDNRLSKVVDINFIDDLDNNQNVIEFLQSK